MRLPKEASVPLAVLTMKFLMKVAKSFVGMAPKTELKNAMTGILTMAMVALQDAYRNSTLFAQGFPAFALFVETLSSKVQTSLVMTATLSQVTGAHRNARLSWAIIVLLGFVFRFAAIV